MGGEVMRTFGSLFSGAGGFDMGFHAAGFRCAWQVEIDPTARDVLARHWPDVPRFEDVRECGKANLPPVDVLVGGFPCQDISIAGGREGLAGERSGLFYELARIAREIRPRFLVWENVAGLLSSDDGRDLARVLRHLGDGGYFGAYRVLDAEGFGVAQTRRRVFGVFARGGAGVGGCAEVLALAESVRRDTPAGGEKGTDVAGPLGGGTPGRGWSDDLERAGAFIPTVARPLTAGGKRPGVSSPGRRQEDDFNLVAFGGNDTRGPRRPAAGLNGRSTSRQDFETETFIVNPAHSCAKESHARPSPVARSLDTTGGFATSQGGTVIVGECIPIDMRQASRGGTMTNNRKPGSSGGAPGTGIGEDGDPCPTLATSHVPAVATRYGVRRLTPLECERIMGWPDDWTRYRPNGKEIKDGPRYRLCGNGVVFPVAHYIARRLMEVMSRI